MFETLKEKIAVSDDELIMAAVLEEESRIKKEASKLKRQAMAEIFKTKDIEFLGATVKKKDNSKKSFFMQ